MSDIMKKHDKYVAVKYIAEETLRLLMDNKKLMQDESPLDRKMAVLLIGELIRLTLDEVLHDRPLEFEGKTLYDYVHKNYTATKSDIELVVGLAFTAAVKQFSGQDLEYMCEIQPIPMPDTERDS